MCIGFFKKLKLQKILITKNSFTYKALPKNSQLGEDFLIKGPKVFK